MQLTDLLTAEGVMSGVYDLAKNVGKLGAAEAVSSTVVGLPGAAIAAALIRSMGTTTPSRQVTEEAMKAADNLLLSPAFMNMVKDQYTGESIKRFGLSAGWQNFARKVGISPEAVNAEDFVRSIRTATIQAVEAPEVMTEETEETLDVPLKQAFPELFLPHRKHAAYRVSQSRQTQEPLLLLCLPPLPKPWPKGQVKVGK